MSIETVPSTEPLATSRRPASTETKPNREVIYRRFHSGANLQLPNPLVEDWNRQLQARCRGLAVNDFFAQRGRAKGGRQVRERRERNAVAVCRPVIKLCRDYAASRAGTLRGVGRTDGGRTYGHLLRRKLAPNMRARAQVRNRPSHRAVGSRPLWPVHSIWDGAEP
ncbi:hypothetical protein KTR9_3408 [Gordonia sp. KTR9]|nr:hypothetical protein KTR9_3408 [Gordonia sp. KTR9]